MRIQGPALDRRALLQSAILLVGGALVPGTALARAATAGFFTPAERAIVDAACDTLIPRTDTPGAIDAGVPAFIDGMMTNWASDETRASFRSVIAGIDAAAKGFAALPPADRAAQLAAYDRAALAGNDRAYRRFRELALMGYYLSEPGATQELRYELAPGVWEPRVAVTPETRAWAV